MEFKTLEDYVGQTPLVRLKRIAAGRNNVILAKLEGNNPAGSVKDRPALSMILRAEARGELEPAAPHERIGVAAPLARDREAVRGRGLLRFRRSHSSVLPGQTRNVSSC